MSDPNQAVPCAFNQKYILIMIVLDRKQCKKSLTRLVFLWTIKWSSRDDLSHV